MPDETRIPTPEETQDLRGELIENGLVALAEDLLKRIEAEVKTGMNPQVASELVRAYKDARKFFSNRHCNYVPKPKLDEFDKRYNEIVESPVARLLGVYK